MSGTSTTASDAACMQHDRRQPSAYSSSEIWDVCGPGQLAGDELHAALAARAVAGARRIDGDVGLARGVEHALLRGDRDHDGLFIVFKLEGQFKHDR